MKRLKLLFAVLFVLLIFSSCSVNTKKELEKDFSAEVVVSAGDAQYKAKITQSFAKRTDIILVENNTFPIEYIFEDSKLTIKYNSLSCTADSDYLPKTSFQEILYSVLCSLDKAQFEKSGEDDEFCLFTENGKVRITAKNGLVTGIFPEYSDIKFEFFMSKRYK